MPWTEAKNERFQTTGQKIMELSDRMVPVLRDRLKGKHDKNGQPVSLSLIRAMALNMAQDVVKAGAK